MWGGKSKPRKKHDLTPQQLAFVTEYLKSANGLQSYKAAGYIAKYPGQAASKLLRHPGVKAAIEKAREESLATGKFNLQIAMEKADKAIEFAYKTDNANALAKLIELQAKLHGLLIEKHDVRTTANFAINIVGIGNSNPNQLEVKPIPLQLKDVNDAGP